MMFSSGLPVVVDLHLCDTRFDRWARWPKSRKKRIRRKWQKRYGSISKCVSDKAFNMAGKLYCCPHVLERLRCTK